MDGVIQQGDTIAPLEAMNYAIEIAYLGRGRVAPNPMVGCVVVDSEHKFLASGFHQRLGEGHAEINALDAAGDSDLSGATLYVTLEPCAHQGRTPSCAKKIAEYPITKVVYGVLDPNPEVNGGGVQIIEAAGIETELFVGLEKEIDELNEIFFCNQNLKRPFVSVKIASSLDGRYATYQDQSKWITGAKSREYSHLLRAGHDAILVGSKTLLIDNPSLNVRYPGFKDIQPQIVVLDPNVKSSKVNLKIFETHSPEKIIIAHEKTLQQTDERFELLHVENSGDGMDLDVLLQNLFERGINSIFVEGGGHTISKFLTSGLVDRVHIFMAPFLMGAGKTWTDGLKLTSPLESKLELKNLTSKNFDQDIYLTGLVSGQITSV